MQSTSAGPWLHLRTLLLFAALTVPLTWPLAGHLRVMDPGDSAFFAWIMGFEIHALKTDPALLPHANIYHPERFATFMDEPILGSTLLGLPLALFTDDAVLIFNVVRLLTFVLSGYGAWLLARELGLGEAAALFAGAAFAFSPIRTDQIAHMSTLGSQWIAPLFLFALRFLRRGRLRDGLLAGLFYALLALACGYHGLFAALCVPAFALPWLRRDRRLVTGSLAAGALAALLLLPLYLAHREALEPHRFERPRSDSVMYAASLESFLATSSWNKLHGAWGDPFRTHSNNLFPGLLVPGLALLGALRLVRARRAPDREALALALLALAAVLVCLGPEIRLFGHTVLPGPYGLIRELVPVFHKVRVTSRAGIFLALPLCLLAARMLHRLQPGRLAMVGLTGVALAEGLVAPLELPGWLKVVDTAKPLPGIYAWLREQPGSFAIAELPMLVHDGYYRRPAHDESVYMVWSTFHWKRLVNGYAGVEPESYRRMRDRLRRFPSEDAIAALEGAGVRYAIVHQAGYGPNQWARLTRDLPAFGDRLREVARFDGDTVYLVVRSAGSPATP